MDAKMCWFQYRNGVAGERNRVAHCADQSVQQGLWSWCRNEFDPAEMEEVAEPGATPDAEQAAPGAPCVPCLMLVMGATNGGAGNGNELGKARGANTTVPGDLSDAFAAKSSGSMTATTVVEDTPDDSPSKTVLAVSMRKAQWLLDDAAHDVSGERYSTAQAVELAEILEELLQLVRKSIGDEQH